MSINLEKWHFYS